MEEITIEYRILGKTGPRISIPSVFLFVGYLERCGLPGWAKDRYAALSVKASACVEYGAFEERCPCQLPIRQMLKKAVLGFGE